MFEELNKINTRPKPFEYYTASDLWTDEHTSAKMLKYHLDREADLSSRNHEFIERSVAWMVSHFAIGPGTRIADFGCGPGLYAARLARHGAIVTGIDFSSRSIEHAKKDAVKEGLNITYVNADYLTFETDGQFDLIIMIMCDFCALGPEQRRVMLEKFRRLLTPGGFILLDVYSLTAFDQREQAATYARNLLNGFWSANDYYGFLNTFKYNDEKVTLDKYTIIEKDRVRTFYNWLQSFSPETLEQELAIAGLSVINVAGNVAGAPFNPDSTEFAIVAAPKGDDK